MKRFTGSNLGALLVVSLFAFSSVAQATITSTFVAGTLTVSSNAGDTITVTSSGGNVKINGADLSSGAASASAITTMTVTGGPLANAIDLSGVSSGTGFTGIASVSLSGAGGDDILTGTAFSDTIDGGTGNDIIVGGKGNDTLTGGAGNDTFIWNNNDGNDNISGDGGTGDIVIVNGSPNAVNGDDILISPANNPARLNVSRAAPNNFSLTIINTEGLQVNADDGPDTITLADLSTVASLTTVTVDGGSGNDYIDASAIASTSTLSITLSGGAGNDIIIGGKSAETLNGGPGNDTLTGGPGDDIINGGPNNDTIIWNDGDGSDIVNGDTGNDLLSVTGSSTFGDDLIVTASLSGALTIQRNNLTTFSITARTIEGASVDAQDQNDTITVYDLSSVSDLLLLNITGGAGNDMIDASACPATTLSISLNGAAGNDTILGSGGVDNIDGGGGDDTITGNKGNDIIHGGGANDNIIWNDGDGNDVITGDGGTGDIVTVNGAVGSPDDIDVMLSAPGHLIVSRSNLTTFTLDITTAERLVLSTKSGEDTITINDLTGVPDLGLITVNAGNSTDTLIINGSANADAITIGTTVTTINGFPIAYDPQLENLQVNGLGGDDTFNPVRSSPTMTINCDGGPHAAGDTFVFDNESLPFTQSPGQVIASGRQPVNYVNMEFPTVPVTLSVLITE